MSVRALVIEHVQGVALQQGKQLRSLEDGARLVDCGLDSVEIAVVIARLDEELDVDPFALDDAQELPVTLGDLIGLYERACV